MGKDKSNNNNSKVKKSGKNDPNGDQEVSYRASIVTLQRYKRSNCLF